MAASMSRSENEPTLVTAEDAAVLHRVLDNVIATSPNVVLPDELLRKVFTAAVRQYSARYEQNLDDYLSPLIEDSVTASDVGSCCMEMLRAADMELFELTMWGSRIPPITGEGSGF
jgi:hypothetical protein